MKREVQRLRVAHTRRNHYKIHSATGEIITTLAHSSSDPRTILNATAQLRAAGADIPRKGTRA